METYRDITTEGKKEYRIGGYNIKIYPVEEIKVTKDNDVSSKVVGYLPYICGRLPHITFTEEVLDGYSLENPLDTMYDAEEAVYDYFLEQEREMKENNY